MKHVITHKPALRLPISLLSELVALYSHNTADGKSTLGFPASLSICSLLFLVHCSHGHLVSLPVYLVATPL